MPTTVNSELVTNLVASPQIASHRKSGRIKTVIDQQAVATSSIDEASDTILLCPIPSNAVIIDLLIMNDDLDSNGAPALEGDFGLVYSGIGGNQTLNGNTIGTAIDLNCFADASAELQAANTSWTSVRNATDDITNVDKEAWEVAGLASDPGGILLVSFTVGTAAATAAAGDLVARVDYI